MPTMAQTLDRHFGYIGARARLISDGIDTVAMDVRGRGRNAYFELQAPARTELRVLNVDRKGRHLLLLSVIDGVKSRFLFGHDERHWFVAAIPEESRGVVSVSLAKQALQPAPVRNIARGLDRKHRDRRHNSAFLRQGEWFFVPAPEFSAPSWTVLRNEPLSRGRGKAHIMEFACRIGGELVYVNRANPSGLNQARFDALTQEQRSNQSWSRMVRNATVYAMGRIRHPDHATLTLKGWHRVFMNTENRAQAMRHVAFLD